MKYERLTVEEIEDFTQRACVQLCPELTRQLFSMAVELIVYKNKIEQGLMIELPCKVGDTVYKVMPIGGVRRIVEFTVSRISITNEVCIFFKKNKNSWHEWCTKPQHIGKAVFLTREEAEAKLKELQE